MTFRKYFIPVDGSANSALACKMAVCLAEMGEESVILAHCFDAIPARIQGQALETLKDELIKEAEKIFDECRPFFEEADIPCESIILFGSQGIALAEAAEAHKCDLIIMGTKGHSNLGTLVLGSVTNAVVHNSSLPVMLVPFKASGTGLL